MYFLLFIFLILLLILILIPIQLKFHLKYPVNDTVELDCQIKLFKLIPIKIKFIDPIIKGTWLFSQHKEPEVKDLPKHVEYSKLDYRLLFYRLRVIYPLMKKIMRRTFQRINKSRPIQIKQLNLLTEIGLGDPALTGISIGTIWFAHGILIGEIGKKFQINTAKKYINVIPIFEGKHLLLNYYCIFDLRIGQIMIIFTEIVRFKGIISKLIKGVIK